MMGRWCEEEGVKRRWRAAERDGRAGRFGSEFGFAGQCCVGVFLAVFVFFTSFFCLFICLLVCFPRVLSLLDEVLGLFIQCLKAWWSESQKNPSLPLCYPHLLLLTGYLLLLLFWQADLSLLPLLLLNRTLVSLSLSFSPSVLWQPRYFLSRRPEKQDKKVRASGGQRCRSSQKKG